MILMLGDWRGLAIRGAFALLFGIITLLWPGLTVLALVLLFGAFAFIDGIMILAGVVGKAPGTQQRRGILIFEGVVGVAIGLMTLIWPDITAVALLWLIAAWALLTGLIEIAAAIALRGEVRHDWVLAVTGGLSVLFGILLAITPGAGALVITWLIGWYATITGVVLLYLAWRARQAASQDGGTIGQTRPAPA